jgi:hypothetical protein
LQETRVSTATFCLVYGTATAIHKFCQAPRMAAETSYATDIPFYEQPTLRLALIPDRFASAAAERPDLGKYSSNGADEESSMHVTFTPTPERRRPRHPMARTRRSALDDSAAGPSFCVARSVCSEVDARMPRHPHR